MGHERTWDKDRFLSRKLRVWFRQDFRQVWFKSIRQAWHLLRLVQLLVHWKVRPRRQGFQPFNIGRRQSVRGNWQRQFRESGLRGGGSGHRGVWAVVCVLRSPFFLSSPLLEPWPLVLPKIFPEQLLANRVYPLQWCFCSLKQQELIADLYISWDTGCIHNNLKGSPWQDKKQWLTFQHIVHAI